MRYRQRAALASFEVFCLWCGVHRDCNASVRWSSVIGSMWSTSVAGAAHRPDGVVQVHWWPSRLRTVARVFGHPGPSRLDRSLLAHLPDIYFGSSWLGCNVPELGSDVWSMNVTTIRLLVALVMITIMAVLFGFAVGVAGFVVTGIGFVGFGVASLILAGFVGLRAHR